MCWSKIKVPGAIHNYLFIFWHYIVNAKNHFFIWKYTFHFFLMVMNLTFNISFIYSTTHFSSKDFLLNISVDCNNLRGVSRVSFSPSNTLFFHDSILSFFALTLNSSLFLSVNRDFFSVSFLHKSLYVFLIAFLFYSLHLSLFNKQASIYLFVIQELSVWVISSPVHGLMAR